MAAPAPACLIFFLGFCFYKIPENIVDNLAHLVRWWQFVPEILMGAYQYPVTDLIDKADPGHQRQLPLLINQHHLEGLECIVEFPPVVKGFRVHVPGKQQRSRYPAVDGRLTVCYLMSIGASWRDRAELVSSNEYAQ
jgi:hypothetical protein